MQQITVLLLPTISIAGALLAIRAVFSIVNSIRKGM